tara:strand:- start:134 stop:418 length:285 start_codon:yes stop_codon:yes gene_type:complete
MIKILLEKIKEEYFMSDKKYLKVHNIAPVEKPDGTKVFNLHAVEQGGVEELNQEVSRQDLQCLADGGAFYGHMIDAKNDQSSLDVLNNALNIEI